MLPAGFAQKRQETDIMERQFPSAEACIDQCENILIPLGNTNMTRALQIMRPRQTRQSPGPSAQKGIDPPPLLLQLSQVCMPIIVIYRPSLQSKINKHD